MKITQNNVILKIICVSFFKCFNALQILIIKIAGKNPNTSNQINSGHVGTLPHRPC